MTNREWLNSLSDEKYDNKELLEELKWLNLELMEKQ